jgi:serine/threonine protein kinase
MDLQTGGFFACKQVLQQQNDLETDSSGLARKKNLLSSLCHKNIVKYMGSATETVTGADCFFEELVYPGSMKRLISEFGSLDEPVMVKYMTGVLSGLQYLHKQNIFHGDVTLNNILVHQSGCVKLIDFTSHLSQPRNTPGTPYFMAPEVIAGSPCTLISDIWSVGCVVIEMATGTPPHFHTSDESMNDMQLLRRLADLPSPVPEIPNRLSYECKDFLQHCFKRTPTERSSCAVLLEHPWMTGNKMILITQQQQHQQQSSPLSNNTNIISNNRTSDLVLSLIQSNLLAGASPISGGVASTDVEELSPSKILNPLVRLSKIDALSAPSFRKVRKTASSDLLQTHHQLIRSTISSPQSDATTVTEVVSTCSTTLQLALRWLSVIRDPQPFDHYLAMADPSETGSLTRTHSQHECGDGDDIIMKAGSSLNVRGPLMNRSFNSPNRFSAEELCVTPSTHPFAPFNQSADDG